MVYVKPGATFAQYRKFAIIDCTVEFSKKWLDDYNNSRERLSRKIGEKDLDKARADLAGQFKKVFTEERQRA